MRSFEFVVETGVCICCDKRFSKEEMHGKFCFGREEGEDAISNICNACISKIYVETNNHINSTIRSLNQLTGSIWKSDK